MVDICKLLWWRLALGLLLASRPCGLLEKQMVSDVFTINSPREQRFLDDHGRCEPDDLGSRCFDFTTGFPCILDVILKRHHLSIIHMTYTSSLIDTRVTTSCVLCWLWQERNGRKTRTQGKKSQARDHLRRIKNTGCKASHNDGSRFVTPSAQKTCKHGFQVVNQEVKSYYYKKRPLDETTRIDLLSWQNCLPLLMSA